MLAGSAVVCVGWPSTRQAASGPGPTGEAWGDLMALAWTNWGTGEGLPSNSVAALALADAGAIWVGTGLQFTTVSRLFPAATALDSPGQPRGPGALSLSPNLPNPFKNSTRIAFSLPSPTRFRWGPTISWTRD